MIAQLSSIVKRRDSSKRKHEVTSLAPCAIRVKADGSVEIDRTGTPVSDDAIRRSDVLRNVSTTIDEVVHLPVSEPVFLRWLHAVSNCTKGFLGQEADEFAVVLTVRAVVLPTCLHSRRVALPLLQLAPSR